jgi:hypothetical protein
MRTWSAHGAGSHALDHWENDCEPGRMYIAEHPIGRHVTVNHWVGGSIRLGESCKSRPCSDAGPFVLEHRPNANSAALKANPSET